MMRTSGRFQVQWRGAAVDLNFVRSTDTTAAADDADVNHGDSIFDNRVVPSSSSVEIAPIIYRFCFIFRESMTKSVEKQVRMFTKKNPSMRNGQTLRRGSQVMQELLLYIL
ncbi:hypothetical protein R6Q59_008006 [Mikania micrantha]